MPRMPLQERRSRLVEAAIEVIAEHGVAAATTRAIVAQADMPLASFHYAFESHTALMVEVVERIQAQDASYILDEMHFRGDTLVAAVEKGLLAYLDAIANRPERHLAEMELNLWALRSKGQNALVTASVESAREAILRLLDGWVAEGETGRGVDREAFAAHMLVLTTGLEMQYFFGQDIASLKATVPALAAGFAQHAR